MAGSFIIHSKAESAGGGLIRLPSWGRCFWQDPNDGELILAYASGDTEIDYVTSLDSGVTWNDPRFLTSCDDFSVDDNFDMMMDHLGHIHIGYQRIGIARYRFLGKNQSWLNGSSGWDAASGNGEITVNPGSVGSSSTAPGFHGTLDYSPGPVGANDFTDTYAHFPIVRFAWQGDGAGGATTQKIRLVNIPWPYDGSETGGAGEWLSESGPNTLLPLPHSGGSFPSWSRTHGSFPTNENVALTWGSSSGTILLATRAFGSWGKSDELKVLPAGGNNGIDTGSGYIPLTQHMTFASGAHNNSPQVGNNWPILTANESGIEMYCVGSEPGGIGSFIARADSHYIGTNGSRDRCPQGWPLGTIGSGMRGTDAADNGINMDISWGNKPGVMHLYFQDHNEIGVQRISRLKVTCEAQAPNITGGFNTKTFTGWRFSSLDHLVSGQITEALATREFTGQSLDADRHFAHWRKFKALRHPVRQTEGVNKREMIVTLGDSINPSGTAYLVATDFAKTLRATAPFILPTFEFETTLPPSGTNALFVGIAQESFSTGDGTAMFDGDTTTGQTTGLNQFFHLEFVRPILITRMEMPWEKFSLTTVYGPIHIQASLDQEDWRTIFTTPGDQGETGSNLFQWQSNKRDAPWAAGDMIKFNIDPFVAKYIRVQFTTNASNHSVREFRVYSPDSTVREILSGEDTSFPPITAQFKREFIIAPPVITLVSIEDFRSTREGERPTGWRTSGDWDWFVRASGEMSKTNKLAVVAPQDGRQHGGVFQGHSNGFGDGFSLRTVESGYGGLKFINPGGNVARTIGAPLGTSGILEVDVDVQSNEITLAGNPGRDISFHVRYDMLGSGVLTPGDPVDDELIFERSQDGLNTRINDYWVQGGCFMTKCDWYRVAYTVPTGVSTLRWTYRRGTVNPPPLNIGERGIVWIDNVKGLDPPPTPAILGFVSADNSFITPTGIYGYLGVTNWNFINSWMFGHDHIIARHGYVLGGPNAESFMLGYLFGPNEGKIDGYLLGGSGTVSIPTGIIDGYVAVRPGVESKMPGFLLAGNVDASGAINGWLAGAVPSGTPMGSIFGTLIGTPSISGSIDGYLKGGFASGTINAYILGPPGATGIIDGYLKTQDNFESIFSYMKTLTSITGVIDCYLKVADGDSEIHAYMLVNEGGPYGYLRGTINGQFINGYLLNTGVSGAIDGYLNVQMNGEIDGYLQGAEFASGSIDGYMQAFASSEINGWLMGISGAPSGAINSFMIGVNAPSEIINAFLIGDPDDTACDNHGTVPLPSLPSYTLPPLSSLINPIAAPLPPISPISILGDKLVAWFDPSVSSSIILNGTGILQMKDLSINSNHLVQTNPLLQPFYDTSTYIKSVVDYNTIEDQFMESSGTPFSDFDDVINVWAVIYIDAIGPLSRPFTIENAAAPGTSLMTFQNQAGGQVRVIIAGSAGAALLTTANTYVALTLNVVRMFSNSQNDHGAQLNRGTIVTSSTTVGTGTMDRFKTNVSSLLNGGHGEIIVARGSLTVDEITEIDDYLRDKWGTP